MNLVKRRKQSGIIDRGSLSLRFLAFLLPLPVPGDRSLHRLPQRLRQRGNRGIGQPVAIFGRHTQQSLILTGGNPVVLLELLLQRTVEPAVIISAPPRLPRLIECNLIKQADQRFRLAGGGGIEILRLLDPGRKLGVELLHHLHPGELALLNFIEFLLHVRSETHIEQRRQPPHQKVIDPETQLRRNQLPLLPGDVVPVLNCAQNGRVGGRASDSVLLQFLDQSRLRITRAAAR